MITAMIVALLLAGDTGPAPPKHINDYPPGFLAQQFNACTEMGKLRGLTAESVHDYCICFIFKAADRVTYEEFDAMDPQRTREFLLGLAHECWAEGHKAVPNKEPEKDPAKPDGEALPSGDGARSL
jgi:hypothetical protein